VDVFAWSMPTEDEYLYGFLINNTKIHMTSLVYSREKVPRPLRSRGPRLGKRPITVHPCLHVHPLSDLYLY
jgi:hypothetical protein